MMIRRRHHNVYIRMGVALALACCLLVSAVGCQPRRCAVDPPDRPIDAPAALASDLQARVARALEEPDSATLAMREGELTAIFRQALEGSPAHDIALHVTEDALYLQMAIGRSRDPIRVALVPAADEGRLAARVLCLTVGDRPLPRVAGAAIESVVTALAEDAAWSSRIESVTLREGTLVLVVERR